MSHPDAHPEPPADLDRRLLPVIGTTGPWFRIHRTLHDALHFGRSGRHRFDAPAGEYGILYLGADEHCAFIEVFGQSTGINVVTTSALAERSLSSVSAARPLRLIDLTGSGLARLGADERLCSGEHALAQGWALALWRHPESVDGLCYRARHDPSRLCVAVYDRARSELSATVLGNLLDPSLAKMLASFLDTYSFGLLST